VVPIIMMGELPEAGKSHTKSQLLLKRWDIGVKRKSLRQKILFSLKPVGYSIGPFFTVGKTTTGKYVDGILNYTVNLIISF
jgi:hypothetical protein